MKYSRSRGHVLFLSLSHTHTPLSFLNKQGEEFDSSYNRGEPTKFAPNQVIKGWTEALQLMVEGDKWELYIPAHLAYGDHGRVPGCLVFTMEIVKINGGTRPKMKKQD